MKPQPTDWALFFRILCLHRPGYGANLQPLIVADFDDHVLSQLARRFYMAPLPEGPAMKRDKIADDFLKTERAARGAGNGVAP